MFAPLEELNEGLPSKADQVYVPEEPEADTCVVPPLPQKDDVTAEALGAAGVALTVTVTGVLAADEHPDTALHDIVTSPFPTLSPARFV
jgi:hypothetical protein